MTTNPKNDKAGSTAARVGRLVLLAGMLTALAVPVAMPVPVRADGPLRSGAIVSGTGETPVNPWVTGMEGCVGAPTCSAWLQSGCAPALAGADPALYASIVDVADLADGVTPRSLGTDGGELQGPPLIVQFWMGSGLEEYDVVDEPAGLDGQGCVELLDHRVGARDCKWWESDGCTFRIPADAKYMTVSTNTQNGILKWTLT